MAQTESDIRLSKRKNFRGFTQLGRFPFLNRVAVQQRYDPIPNCAVSQERPLDVAALLGFDMTDGFASY